MQLVTPLQPITVKLSDNSIYEYHILFGNFTLKTCGSGNGCFEAADGSRLTFQNGHFVNQRGNIYVYNSIKRVFVANPTDNNCTITLFNGNTLTAVLPTNIHAYPTSLFNNLGFFFKSATGTFAPASVISNSIQTMMPDGTQIYCLQAGTLQTSLSAAIPVYSFLDKRNNLLTLDTTIGKFNYYTIITKSDAGSYNAYVYDPTNAQFNVVNLDIAAAGPPVTSKFVSSSFSTPQTSNFLIPNALSSDGSPLKAPAGPTGYFKDTDDQYTYNFNPQTGRFATNPIDNKTAIMLIDGNIVVYDRSNETFSTRCGEHIKYPYALMPTGDLYIYDPSENKFQDMSFATVSYDQSSGTFYL